MKKKKSTSNPTWQAFKQHKRGWLALRILAVLFVVTLLAPLWSNDKPLWIRYQGEYFFPLVNEYNETAFGGDFDTPADYLDPLIRHNITSDGNFALYLPNPYDADTLNDFCQTVRTAYLGNGRPRPRPVGALGLRFPRFTAVCLGVDCGDYRNRRGCRRGAGLFRRQN